MDGVTRTRPDILGHLRHLFPIPSISTLLQVQLVVVKKYTPSLFPATDELLGNLAPLGNGFVHLGEAVAGREEQEVIRNQPVGYTGSDCSAPLYEVKCLIC